MKFLLFFLAFGGTGQSVPPGVQNQIRPELENLEIRERLGERVADISFVDEEGNQHSLSSYAGDLPLILIPAYNRCKNLCPMVLKGVLEGLRGLNLRAGKDYRLLTVSFDSSDGMALTREAAKRYRQALIPPEAWRFVPGTDTAAVRPLLRSVGYPFRPIPGKGMFAHVAAVVCSPRISVCPVISTASPSGLGTCGLPSWKPEKGGLVPWWIGFFSIAIAMIRRRVDTDWWPFV